MKPTSRTTLCAVIGDPVAHSLSPLIHNAAYAATNLDYAYLAFRVSNVQNALRGIRALGIRGASVTAPHKIEVMKFLDTIDRRAKEIGAVNTILNDGGLLSGYNTDCEGAMRALEEKISLAGKKAVLLGAGGAARAIAFGLREKGVSLCVVNRTAAKARDLARSMGARGGDFSLLAEIRKSDIVINTIPNEIISRDDSLVPDGILHPDLLAFDISYTPRETAFVAKSRKAGCDILHGYKMLLHQAVLQFEIFTGLAAPISVMEEALKSHLGI